MKSLKQNKLLEAERRKRYLETLIKEAIINVLAEQQQDVPPASPAPPAPLPELPPEDPAAPEEQQVEEFTVDSMIERLNVIRGGKSFTDPVVYGQLVTYFKGLNDEQKSHLQSFLMALGKIVINVQDQEEGTPAPQNQSVQAPPAPPPPAAPAPSAAPTAPSPPIAEANKKVIKK